MFIAQCKEDIDTLNHHINDTQGFGKKARIVQMVQQESVGSGANVLQ